MTYSKDNFFISSIAEFIPVDKNKVDLTKPDFESESGSKYYYNKFGVYRYSDHWNSVASCFWALKDNNNSELKTLAFCEWSKFGEIIQMRDCEESLKMDYDRFEREYSFEEYFGMYKDYPEYEDDKSYLFYEFYSLFKSSMNGQTMNAHPNHYTCGLITVVKNEYFEMFKHLLDYEEKQYCDKCHTEVVDGYCACYSKEMEEKETEESRLRQIDFDAYKEKEKLKVRIPRKIRARRNRELLINISN